LSAEDVCAWHDIVGAAPDVLRAMDNSFVAATATLLQRWRSGGREPGLLHLAYRMLGNCFIPMRERRRLLFPERARQA
jgi:hypothetical protein